MNTDKHTSFGEYSRSERASMLVDGIVNLDLPEEIRERIRHWFKSGVSEEEKYEAFAAVILELKENTCPDEYDERKLRELHDILGLPYNDEPETKQPAIKKINSGRRLALRVAAVVIPALMIIGGAYLWIDWGIDPAVRPPVPVVTVSTTAGDQKHLILPDSTQVWLNESSVLVYPADLTADRKVELKGEAYFSVKKAGGATFSVKAGGLTATVLGTRFNVRSYDCDTETEVTLHEGSIRVEAAHRTFLMEPRDRLSLDNSSERVRLEEMADSGSMWRHGVDFHDDQLGEIFLAIASRFNLELEISGTLPDDRIRFGFDYDMTPEAILDVLKNGYPYFTYEITDRKLTVTAN